MRILLFLSALFLHLAATAQTAVISGKIIKPVGDKVSVSYNKGAAIYGFNEVKVETTLDKKGRFRIELPINAPAEVALHQGNEVAFMFLEPGDAVSLSLNTDQFDESLRYEGKGAANNNFMAQYFLKFIDLSGEQSKVKYTRLVNSSVKDYILFKDSIDTEKRKFYEQNQSNLSNAYKHYFSNRISYENANDKLNYPVFMQYYTKKRPELPVDYYNFLKDVRIQNDSALAMNEYVNFLDNFLNYEVERLRKESQNKDFKFYLVKYDLAKGLLSGKVQEVKLADITKDALSYMVFANSQQLYKDFQENVKDKDLLSFVAKKYDKKKLLAEGAMAPTFTLKDTSGKTVSLQDFKGKIVYMDFWASWCGPCMQEAPYTVKLQEQFKDKDIVLLYISGDESEEMWRKAIREKNLGNGVHLISKKSAENVQEKYDVDGIPSYFLIDRNGKIINGSASRPSEEKTVELLNNALSQQ